MKKTIFTVLTLAFLGLSTTYAQVGIGTITPHAEALLDFGTDPKGMVLSPIDDATAIASPAPGTIAFDGATGSFRTYDGSWSAPIAGGVTGSANTAPNTTTQGVIIGATTSTVDGAIVLEANSSKKTLILPKVAAVEFTIKTPTVGMIVYDSVTDQVKVYNGTAWTNF